MRRNHWIPWTRRRQHSRLTGSVLLPVNFVVSMLVPLINIYESDCFVVKRIHRFEKPVVHLGKTSPVLHECGSLSSNNCFFLFYRYLSTFLPFFSFLSSPVFPFADGPSFFTFDQWVHSSSSFGNNILSPLSSHTLLQFNFALNFLSLFLLSRWLSDSLKKSINCILFTQNPTCSHWCVKAEFREESAH